MIKQNNIFVTIQDISINKNDDKITYKYNKQTNYYGFYT